MENGKSLAICHLPFAISDQAGIFQRPAAGGVSGSRPSSHRPRHNPETFLTLQRNHAMLRELRGAAVVRACDEQMQNARQAGEMSRQHNRPLVPTQTVSYPFGWIGGLQSSDRCQLSGWIARASECVRGLACAQLAAVPDHVGPHAACRRFGCQPRRMLTTVRRQRPLRIDFGPDRVRVMD
jgi:hypothetical protein